MTEYLGNPAGRLYAFLKDFHDEAGSTITIQTAWANALGVSPGEVPMKLVRMSSLYLEIEVAINSDGREVLTTGWETFGDAWADPVLHPDYTLQDASDKVADKKSLGALGIYAAMLADRSESLPGASAARRESLTSMRESIEEARRAVIEDAHLPASLRAMMVERLHDMLWSIDHLDIMGDEAVAAAAERLAGRIATVSVDTRQRYTVLKTVGKVVGQVLRIFPYLLDGGGSEVAGFLEGVTPPKAIESRREDGSSDGTGV